ncbi:MAG: hypothetical protein CMO81_12095 [Waddliaceae bacterium]|nr:hypothetical protein [Waddliaceae bacterium]
MFQKKLSSDDFIDPSKILEHSDKVALGVNQGKTLKEIFEVSDETMHAKYALAHEVLARGDAIAASNLFAYLAAFDPFNPNYWLALSSTYAYLGNTAKSINTLSVATLLDEKSDLLLVLSAHAFVLEGDTKSLEELRKAISKIKNKDLLKIGTELIEDKQADAKKGLKLIWNMMDPNQKDPLRSNKSVLQVEKIEERQGQLDHMLDQAMNNELPVRLQGLAKQLKQDFGGSLTVFAMNFLGEG